MKREPDLKEKLLRIKQKKQLRDKILILKLSGVILFFGVLIFILVSMVSSFVNFIKAAKPKEPEPPVNLMSYNEMVPDDVQNQDNKQGFIYKEPLKLPKKHEFSGNSDRITDVLASEKKVCYLTFDDGPSTVVTPQILDVLRRFDVKATFFQVGILIESNPDIARRVFEEGHLIANHSYSHNYKEVYASEDSFMTDIIKTEELIKGVLDNDEDFYPVIRLPGGSYNTGTYKDIKQSIKTVLAENGYFYCDWNALNGDSEGAKKDKQQLFDYLKQTLNTDKSAVVLMHDAANKQSTVESLEHIIKYMKEKGYVFLRLDEEF